MVRTCTVCVNLRFISLSHLPLVSLKNEGGKFRDGVDLTFTPDPLKNDNRRLDGKTVDMKEVIYSLALRNLVWFYIVYINMSRTNLKSTFFLSIKKLRHPQNILK